MNFNSYIVSGTKTAFSVPVASQIPNTKKCLKEKAFTLAETLITLSIIGVVAAMTVPTLMSNQNDKITVTKLKKAQSVLSNAVKITQAEGKFELEPATTTSSGWISEDIGKTFEAIAQNLKYVAHCFDTGCTPFSHSVELEDGMIFGTHAHAFNGQINVVVDKKAKIQERNYRNYAFEINTDGTIMPAGAPNTNKELTINTTCPKTDYWPEDNSCTYWTLKTGKVKKKAGEWF